MTRLCDEQLTDSCCVGTINGKCDRNPSLINDRLIEAAFGVSVVTIPADMENCLRCSKEKTMDPKELLEKLADLEHTQWAHWTKYMLDNLTPKNIARWKKQIKTPYEDLSEEDKEKDREWVYKVIDILDDK